MAVTRLSRHAPDGRPGLRRRAALAWAGAVAAGLLAHRGVVAAQPRVPESSEAAIKAAYLVKFLAYVQWPPAALPTPESPQVIGVLGADAVLAELEALLASRRPGGRPLLARRVLPDDGVEGLHVLHVGRGARPSAVLTAALAGKPVLTVSDLPAPAEWGAINFVVVDQRVRFEVSLAAAERAGLRLSARLLEVAERVLGPERVP